MSGEQLKDYDLEIRLKVNTETRETEYHFLDKDGNHFTDNNGVVPVGIVWKAKLALLWFLQNIEMWMKPKEI